MSPGMQQLRVDCSLSLHKNLNYQHLVDRATRVADRTGRSPGPLPERKAQRAVQDVALAEMRHEFDSSAKDNHAKYERCHWAVVGEGSQSANANYARGYAKIDWSA